jgi:hypothetical protein
MNDNMTLLLLEKFVNYLCLSQKGTKRKKFPSKEALIFASELKEYLFSYKKQFTCAKKDDDLESVEKLSHALQICACREGEFIYYIIYINLPPPAGTVPLFQKAHS